MVIGEGFTLGVIEVHAFTRLTGFEGRIVWDTTKRNGQPRRKVDTSRAEQEFGFRAQTSFEEGSRRIIGWFVAQREADRQPVADKVRN